SIEKYDFQDPIKYDPSLNDGKGGIVFGNGRLEWLHHAKKASQAAPRGIREQDGEWYVPVLFGVEFATEEEAIAFSISHNLSPLWGADGLTFLDSVKLFDQDLLKVQLTELADISIDLLPVGIDGNDLDLMLGLDGPGIDPDADDMWKGLPEFEQNNEEAKYSIKVNFYSENDIAEFAELVGQTVTTKTKSINFPYIKPEKGFECINES
ncbi:MAG: hypothetical protein ACRC62_39315, partial [Microcoleus sp.]